VKLSCELCPNEDTNKCNICQMDLGKEICMDIKELLKQADERVTRINNLTRHITHIDTVISDIEKDDLVITGYDIALYVGEETTEQLKQHIIATMETTKKNKLAELEQMLGIQKEEITVVKNCITGEEITVKDPVGATDKEIKQAINNIFGTEIISIPSDSWNAPEDKSLSKYPAPKRDKRKKYPENMTEDVVRRMYIDEGKSKKEIAEHFGVKESTVNNYLYLRGISRHKRKSKKPDSDEKERP